MKKYRTFSFLLLIPIILSMLCVPSFALEEPELQCRNAVLVDANYGEVLYSKGAYDKAYPASITKVMTALLVMEALESGQLTTDTVVTVSELAAQKSYANESSADLKAGEQHLNGEEALQVMRFRSGYAMADLERVNVQRAFLQAAMDQWLNGTAVIRAPIAGAMVLRDVVTDLSPGNGIWLLKALLLCDREEMVTQTLPGVPQYINGGSYFVPDSYALSQLMEEYYSPYV